MTRFKLSTFALAAALVLPLATVGCSQGSSPTEPAFDDELASASSLSAATGESKGRGHGGDDKTDDNDNNRRRGRGGNGNGDDGNQPGRPARNGQEFEGAVGSVGAGSLTLAGGRRIVVNGATQWSGRGDLFSLSQVSGSLAAGNAPRVEGRGTRQADGSILASTIKAEHLGD
jgi:hypothetical protein